MIAELFDGTEVEFPDGTSPDVVQRTVKRLTAERQSANRTKAGEMALEGTSMLERGLIGAGKTVSNVIGGAKQLVGMGASPQEVRETRERDAPLNSGAALAGQIGAYLPTMLIPGANTYAGSAAIGGGIGALQEAEGAGDRIGNTLMGAGASVVGKLGGDKLAKALSNRLLAKSTAAATRQSQNATRDATLAAAKEAGYVVPPSAVKPSFLTNRLESISGKAAIGQEAAAKNQQVTNALVRKALGLSDDAPLDQASLDAIRKAQGKAYQEVAAISDDSRFLIPGPRQQTAAEALEQLKQARFEAASNYKFYNRSADPEALTRARAASAEAKRLEDFLEAAAAKAGRNDLVPELRKARAVIAKTHDVERALNDSAGEVSAQKLAQMLRSGKPLTGELKTAAQFAEAFPAYAREGAKIPTPGVSKSEALSALLLGTIGGATTGPTGLALAALPLLSGPVRSGLLTRSGQAMFASPSYSTPMATRLAAALANSPRLQAAVPGVSAGVSPFLIEALK